MVLLCGVAVYMKLIFKKLKTTINCLLKYLSDDTLGLTLINYTNIIEYKK